MIRDKTRVKGMVQGTVISMDVVGLKKLEALRVRFPERKKNPQYVEERDAIYAEHGSQKRRVTWNTLVYLTMLQCLIRAKFKLAFQVFQFEMGVNHNIVTDQGDAMIADLMATTPVLTKVDVTNGYIDVGTGWTGTTPKQNEVINTPCVTPATAPELMEATYPKIKGAFGAADDNVTQYRVIFEAGDIDDVGIDEAGLINNVARATADMLAYGQITPAVDVGSTDTLQVDWELTFLGA